MLLPTVPLKNDINSEALADIEGVCGRDIRNAIVNAAIKTAIDGDNCISQQVLEKAINAIIESNKQVQGQGGNLSESEKREIGRKVKLQIRKEKIKRHYL
jgi:ATP-dependent Zn protease